LLRQSDTPDRIVKYKGYESSHIHRAAQYGLLDLIKRFCEQDRRYLKKKFFKKERTLLHEAAWSHRDLVQYLLDAGANPNVPDKQGWPPIAAAITMGRKEIFDLLCKKTTRKGLNGPFGSTMLHYCSSSGQKDMAKFLIEKYRLRPDQKDNNNFIPLQYAASNGHEEVFKFLAASSEIGVKDKWGRTVLHFAAEKGHTNLVQYLLKNDDLEESFFNAEDTDGNTAFHYAVVNHHADVVHVLLEVCDPNQKNRKLDTPLHLVIKEDSLAVNRVSLDRQINTVKMLLNDYRIDPNLLNTQGQTPLGKANQIREIQELLLNHPRFDPMALNGKKPQIVDCIRGKYWDALKHLSTKVKGALDAHKNTLLHLLFRENEVPDEILKDILAKFKTDINTLNENEWKQTQTPLQILLSKPKHQINWNLIVEILEAPELDLNNYKGNFYSVLTLLLFDLFDELNPVEDSIKENILTKMAKWNLSILLSQWDYCTWTPLHRLIVCQQTSAIRWLVAQGIDLAQVDHLDYFRRTPIDLATSSMQKEFALNERSSMPAKSWDSALSWTPVDSEKRVDLLSQVKLEDERYPIDERASFEWTELSFYQTKEIQLLRIYSEAWDNQLLKVYYLYTNEQLHRLKGESKPIHYVNALNLLKIDESTILDYLRFFCFFVRGVDGPFLIAEGTEQAEIKPLDLSSEDRQQLEQNLIPACFSFHDKQANQFFVTASVYYSNYIFYADFRIDAKTGMVEMLWDYPVRGFSKRIHQPIETNPSVTV
jgi:ankyrin repeat protein